MEEVAEKSASVAEGASASEETDAGLDRLETAEPDPRNPAEASGPEVLQVDREDLAADGQGMEVESGTKEVEVADGSVKKPESEVRSEGAAEAQDKMTSAEDKNVAPGDDVDTDNDVMEVDDSDVGEVEENKADEEKKPEPIEAKAGVNEIGQNPVKAGDGDASSSDSGSIADLVSELIKPKPKPKRRVFIDWVCVNPDCTRDGKPNPELVTTARDFVLGHFGKFQFSSGTWTIKGLVALKDAIS